MATQYVTCWKFLFIILALILNLSACATDHTVDRLLYEAPIPESGQTVSTIYEEGAENVWRKVVSAAEQSDLSIDHVDNDNRLLVLTYKGEPATNIDCGTIRQFRSGQFGTAHERDSYPAASARQSFVRNFRSRSYVVDRSMALASRIVVRVEGNQRAAVSARALHVVTKTLKITDNWSGETDINKETIMLSSDAEGEFNRAVICQSTGRLERLLLQDI